MPVDTPFEVIYNAVMSAIFERIARARGSCVTFTVYQLAKQAGLKPRPIVLTVIRSIVEDLMAKGQVQICWRNKRYIRYMVTKDSELWKEAKGLTPECLQH